MPKKQFIIFIKVFKGEKQPGSEVKCTSSLAATLWKSTNTDSSLAVKDFMSKNYIEQLEKKSSLCTLNGQQYGFFVLRAIN